MSFFNCNIPADTGKTSTEREREREMQNGSIIFIEI